MTDPIEDWMRPITDAARIVKASLPKGHGLELADLVSIGAERVLRYLGEAPSSAVLVFVCARQGMESEARRWSARGTHAGRRVKARLEFCDYDEARDVAYWDQWRRYTLPVETMIDMKRALLAMQLREAVSWYSHHWLGEELDHLERELGVTDGRVQQYCASARKKLAATWRGEHFETEGEIAARKARQIAERDARRAAANARMLAARRERFAELKRLGAEPGQAKIGSRSKVQFATAYRQLTAEAAE